MIVVVGGSSVRSDGHGLIRVVIDGESTDVGMVGANDVLDVAVEYQEIRSFGAVVAKFPIGANVTVPVRACTGDLMEQLAGFFRDPRCCVIEVEARAPSLPRTLRFPKAWIQEVRFDPTRQEGGLRFYAHFDERVNAFLELLHGVAA